GRRGKRAGAGGRVRGWGPGGGATTARSASVTTGGSMTSSMLPAPPLRDVLDDEQVLARTHVAEGTRRGRERGQRRGVGEPLLETRLLPLQLPDGGDPGGALRASIDIVVQQ